MLADIVVNPADVMGFKPPGQLTLKGLTAPYNYNLRRKSHE